MVGVLKDEWYCFFIRQQGGSSLWGFTVMLRGWG